jgi:hypothetical protein
MTAIVSDMGEFWNTTRAVEDIADILSHRRPLVMTHPAARKYAGGSR